MKYLLLLLSFFISTFLYCQNNIDTSHLLFDGMKSKYTEEFSNKCDTFKVHLNDNEAKKMVAFLCRDFNTKAFNKFKSVKYWYCETKDIDNKRLHFGVISIVFKKQMDFKAAIKTIKATQRRNFKLKLLTRFLLKESKYELLIYYSNTMRNIRTDSFMKNH